MIRTKNMPRPSRLLSNATYAIIVAIRIVQVPNVVVSVALSKMAAIVSIVILQCALASAAAPSVVALPCLPASICIAPWQVSACARDVIRSNVS